MRKLLLTLGALTMALAYGLLYAGLRTTTGSAAVVATLVEPVTAKRSSPRRCKAASPANRCAA